MLNLTVMTGRLVEDPELRYTNNETPVTTYRIAVRRDYAKKGDDDAVDFFDVVAWRQTAEFVCKYFKKGSLVQVVGRLENRRWKDKFDQNRVTAQLIADNVYFGESKGKADADSDAYTFEEDAESNGVDNFATGSGNSSAANSAANTSSAFPPGFDPFA